MSPCLRETQIGVEGIHADAPLSAIFPNSHPRLHPSRRHLCRVRSDQRRYDQHLYKERFEPASVPSSHTDSSALPCHSATIGPDGRRSVGRLFPADDGVLKVRSTRRRRSKPLANPRSPCFPLPANPANTSRPGYATLEPERSTRSRTFAASKAAPTCARVCPDVVVSVTSIRSHQRRDLTPLIGVTHPTTWSLARRVAGQESWWSARSVSPPRGDELASESP